MARHIFDHNALFRGGRVKHFVAVERVHAREGTHPAVRALLERPVTAQSVTRLREFFRIERGWTV